MILKKRYGVYPSLALLITTVAITIRTIACFTALNYQSGYFTSVLGAVSGWVEAACCLLLFTYVFAARRAEFVASFTSPVTYIPTGTLATAIFFMALELFLVKDTLSSPYARIVATAASILAVLAIAYFILTALIDERHDLVRATFGLFAVLFFAAYAAYLYFNTDLPINSPNKLTDQSAYLAVAIFFLYEIRISLGREKWRAYTAFGFISASLLAFASVPELILFVANGTVIANAVYESILTFALFIFVTARLAVASSAKEDGECEFIKTLKSAALDRQREIEATMPEPEEESVEIAEVAEQVSFDIPDFTPAAEQSADAELDITFAQECEEDEVVIEQTTDAEPTIEKPADTEPESEPNGEEEPMITENESTEQEELSIGDGASEEENETEAADKAEKEDAE